MEIESGWFGIGVAKRRYFLAWGEVSDSERNPRSEAPTKPSRVAKRRHFEWQRGYGAFSVSKSMAGPVSDYLARQRERHRQHENAFAYFMYRDRNRMPSLRDSGRLVGTSTWGSTRYRSFHPRLENTTASQFQSKATDDQFVA